MDKARMIEYISQTANAELEELIPVSGGLSTAKKFKAKLNGQEWMVKLSTGTEVRDIWYQELDKRSNEQMANPKMHKRFNDGTLCLISPWIMGESLESRLRKATQEQVHNYGVQAAQLLLHLHECSFPYSGYSQLLSTRVNMACSQVKELGLLFPGHQMCCEFLNKMMENYTTEHICFVHKDIRPENFIVCEEKLHLIDFDNGSLGERASDFFYLTTMEINGHYDFSRALIEYYLQSVTEDNFWQKNLFYSTLQVVEYAIWKFQNTGRQMKLQAENLISQYDSFNQVMPLWWRKKN